MKESLRNVCAWSQTWVLGVLIMFWQFGGCFDCILAFGWVPDHQDCKKSGFQKINFCIFFIKTLFVPMFQTTPTSFKPMTDSRPFE